jgi:biopolymer transport protein ExbD
MSFTSETRERSRPFLPLAGMVDVLFLLLIFFMTASVFREQEPAMPVNLAPAESAQAEAGGQTHTLITVMDDERVFLGGNEVTLQELRRRLNELAAEFPNEVIVIRGDEASRWGLGLQIMDMAREAGLSEVRAAAAQPEEEQ